MRHSLNSFLIPFSLRMWVVVVVCLVTLLSVFIYVERSRRNISSNPSYGWAENFFREIVEQLSGEPRTTSGKAIRFTSSLFVFVLGTSYSATLTLCLVARHPGELPSIEKLRSGEFPSSKVATLGFGAIIQYMEERILECESKCQFS